MDYKIKAKYAKHPKTPSGILDYLSKDDDYYIRRIVALNENATPEILTRLASDSELEVRLSVARNRNTPEDILLKLYNESNNADKRNMQLSLLDNDNAPSSIIDDCAKSDDDGIRCAAAYHINISLDTLNAMVNDECTEVRANVAKWTNSIDVLKILSNDSDAYVRCCAAYNKHLTDELIIKLSKDADEDVIKTLAYNQNISVQILKIIINNETNVHRKINFLSNPNVTKQLMEETLQNNINNEDFLVSFLNLAWCIDRENYKNVSNIELIECILNVFTIISKLPNIEKFKNPLLFAARRIIDYDGTPIDI